MGVTDENIRLIAVIRPDFCHRESSCTEAAGYYEVVYCSVCGQEASRTKHDSGEALGHSWSDWTTTKAASCTVEGSKERTCGRCGEELSRTPKTEAAGDARPEPEATTEATEVAAEPEAPAEQPEVIELPQKPKSKMAIALEDLAKRDFAAVELTVKEILEEKPNDAAALNLKAAAEMAQGDAKAAEKTLDQAIMSNPRGYHAFYNMARLMAGLKGNRSGAKHYYEAGRSLGGPVDAKLEELLK